ncbi:hypothetical protein Mgra_00006169 [Meloidogyne graminicola]|uniref:Uncharacterized protein n=1 Tax=Meloidogyne graminicola TaxID=189291 RepID=A0A8S9ZLZ1_9BILA|nr:hypothetical protein Mgra_00006169 [Meloidogyne graminicola]
MFYNFKKHVKTENCKENIEISEKNKKKSHLCFTDTRIHLPLTDFIAHTYAPILFEVICNNQTLYFFGQICNLEREEKETYACSF